MLGILPREICFHLYAYLGPNVRHVARVDRQQHGYIQDYFLRHLLPRKTASEYLTCVAQAGYWFYAWMAMSTLRERFAAHAEISWFQVLTDTVDAAAEAGQWNYVQWLLHYDYLLAPTAFLAAVRAGNLLAIRYMSRRYHLSPTVLEEGMEEAGRYARYEVERYILSRLPRETGYLQALARYGHTKLLLLHFHNAQLDLFSPLTRYHDVVLTAFRAGQVRTGIALLEAEVPEVNELPVGHCTVAEFEEVRELLPSLRVHFSRHLDLDAAMYCAIECNNHALVRHLLTLPRSPSRTLRTAVQFDYVRLLKSKYLNLWPKEGERNVLYRKLLDTAIKHCSWQCARRLWKLYARLGISESTVQEYFTQYFDQLSDHLVHWIDFAWERGYRNGDKLWPVVIASDNVKIARRLLLNINVAAKPDEIGRLERALAQHKTQVALALLQHLPAVQRREFLSKPRIWPLTHEVKPGQIVNCACPDEVDPLLPYLRQEGVVFKVADLFVQRGIFTLPIVQWLTENITVDKKVLSCLLYAGHCAGPHNPLRYLLTRWPAQVDELLLEMPRDLSLLDFRYWLNITINRGEVLRHAMRIKNAEILAMCQREVPQEYTAVKKALSRMERLRVEKIEKEVHHSL